MKGFVYFIGNDEFVKIGYSTDPKNRLKYIQSGHPHKLKLFGCIRGDMKLERELHEKFKEHRLNGEWFTYSLEIKSFIEGINFYKKNTFYEKVYYERISELLEFYVEFKGINEVTEQEIEFIARLVKLDMNGVITWKNMIILLNKLKENPTLENLI
jgi:hypothetical protein